MPDHTVYVIRHGEKPVAEVPDPGLEVDGTTDPEALVVKGWQRAGAWAVLFGSPLVDTYLRPDAIYASTPVGRPGEPPPSKRPWQTIVPLAERLGIEPRLAWSQGQEWQLVDEVVKREGVTLICWEHRLIVDGILARLPVEPGASLPGRWKGHRFDVVFKLHRSRRDDPYAFEQLTPCLLDGDEGHPMH